MKKFLNTLFRAKKKFDKAEKKEQFYQVLADGYFSSILNNTQY